MNGHIEQLVSLNIYTYTATLLDQETFRGRRGKGGNGVRGRDLRKGNVRGRERGGVTKV